MKQLFAFLIVLLISLSSFSQVFYISSITVNPANPTDSDIVSVNIAGSLSATNVYIQNTNYSINGNDLYFYFSVGTTSPNGLTVLVPFDTTFQIGMLANGLYHIHLLGNSIYDQSPNSDKQFTVADQNINCTADFHYFTNPDSMYASAFFQYQFFDASSYFVGNLPVAWYWDFGDGTTSTLQNPIHNLYLTPNGYQVCLTVTFTNGCTASYCEQINPTNFVYCNTAFSWSQISMSALNVINFTDSSSGNVVHWHWDFGDGSTSNDQNPVHLFQNSGTYNVCLTTYTSDQCMNIHCETITIGNPITSCNADFSFQPNTLVNCLYCFDFSDYSTTTSGQIISWYWDFGDSTFSTDQNPMHTFPNGGTYNVCLTISTDDNCTSTFCHQVKTNGNPTNCNSDFSFVPTTQSPQPLSLDLFQFTDLSSGNITNWYWDFGDSSLSTLQNPIHGYFNMIQASYPVCLTIVANNGCNDTHCDTINVPQIQNCQASFVAYTDSVGSAIPEIIPVVFENQSIPLDNSTIYLWDFGDGQTSNQIHPIHNYWINNWGWNMVCLTITTANGCTSTYCDSIYVGYNQPCNLTLSFNITDVSVFGGNDGAIDLNISGGTNPYAFQWSTGELTEDIYNLSAGIYTVQVVDANGCTITGTAQIMQPPDTSQTCQAEFIIQPAPGIGNTFHFADVSYGGGGTTQWYWDFGDGNTSGLQSPDHTYNSSGVFSVCLTIITQNGCTSTYCDTVQVVNLCLTVTYNVTNCSGAGVADGAIDLTISGGYPPYSINWDNGATTEDLNNLLPGNYTFYVTDQSWCFVSETVIVGFDSLVSLPWSYSNTGNNHTVLIPDWANISIDNANLQAGSYIGVFYDSLGTLSCAGYSEWTGTTTFLVAWGADNGNDGMAVGEEFKWKFFDMTSGQEFNAIATYQYNGFSDSSLYSPNGISGIASLHATTQLTQILTFPQGWSMISGFVFPDMPDFANVFQSISLNVILAKNGNGLIYWPTYNINSIGNMAIGAGYQFKMTQSDTIAITGDVIIPEQNPIVLSVGWNMIAYLRQSPASVEQMFATIENDLIIAKDENGLVYWPLYNLNAIGNLNPGKGYQLKMTNTVNLLYPAN